jgi:hypothetical protein
MPSFSDIEVPSIDVDFEVYCDNCGAGLCRDTRVRGTTIHVSPCSNCMDNEYERGKADASN